MNGEVSRAVVGSAGGGQGLGSPGLGSPMPMGGGGEAGAAAAAASLYSLSQLAALHSNLLSLSGGGGSPLDFSQASLGPEADARTVDYRGEKVAGFTVDGLTMICLPQAYELFLKNLVGGLHTVYTKLKRLDISPRICNVEQVRALRSMGAIQPGVNRCKLISCEDFDVLYQDCTSSSSSRPGRPPKRSPSFPPLTNDQPSNALHPNNALNQSLHAPNPNADPQALSPNPPLKKPRHDLSENGGGGGGNGGSMLGLAGFLPGLGGLGGGMGPGMASPMGPMGLTPHQLNSLMVHRMLSAQFGAAQQAQDLSQGQDDPASAVGQPEADSANADADEGRRDPGLPPNGLVHQGPANGRGPTPQALQPPSPTPARPPSDATNRVGSSGAESSGGGGSSAEAGLRQAMSLLEGALSWASSLDASRREAADLRAALAAERRGREAADRRLADQTRLRAQFQRRYNRVRRSKARLHLHYLDLLGLGQGDKEAKGPVKEEAAQEAEPHDAFVVHPTAPPFS